MTIRTVNWKENWKELKEYTICPYDYYYKGIPTTLLSYTNLVKDRILGASCYKRK